MAFRTDDEIDEVTIENDEQLAEALARVEALLSFVDSFRHPNPDVETASRAGARSAAVGLRRKIDDYLGRREEPRHILKALAAKLREYVTRPGGDFLLGLDVNDTEVETWPFGADVACRLADLIDPPKFPTAQADAQDEPNGEGA